MSPHDFDFARLYRERLAALGRRSKPPEHWDARAARTDRDIFDSAYAREFVARMNLSGCRTLLDVGCGAGTIGLSVAARLNHVYGLDYSQGMLGAFTENARSRGFAHVTPILRAWEDDWSGVPVCDVVVASRSTALPDLEWAIRKLNAQARVRVYLTYPADGHFIPDGVRRVLGPNGNGLPDFLYVIGILRNLGLQPTLDYLPGENRLANCSTFEQFLGRISEAIGPLADADVTRLADYFGDPDARRAEEKMRWALFTWEVGA